MQRRILKTVFEENIMGTDEKNKKSKNIDLTLDDNKLYEKLEEINSNLIKQNSILIQEIRNLKQEIDRITTSINTTKLVSKEILWSEIFNNTISDSKWLKDKSFSPGRWAVGYQYLYAVYRILNEAKPKNILELGLGQSTRLLSQYVRVNKDAEHLIVEHDKNWIEFFSNEFRLPENSNIVQLELENREFKEDTEVLCYKDFYEALKNRKFDFISIDAPFGFNAKVYARIDVLKIMPQSLAENFVIVIDDYNRKGEKNTVLEMEKILTENGIKYAKGVYTGEKECLVITSENNKFLTSM